MDRLERIEAKIDQLTETVHELSMEHRERIAKLETNQRGFIAGIASLWTLVIAYLGTRLGIK